ncbi:rhodanese-like domain-containing protein [Bacillus salitolerans]|uniref:Rhodanese-like domain-containing protein n=1 Tax=Bacillus salitolerans TaxID=1437434 RepID=A0ABW4LWU2_9BACI
MLEYINYLLLVMLFFIINRMLPAKGVRHITTLDLKNELKDKNKQFVDVRTPSEYKSNHIKGFKNLPLHQLAGGATKELSKEKEVVVICQSGMRSQKASKFLKKLGFAHVTNVKGGMSAWRS